MTDRPIAKEVRMNEMVERVARAIYETNPDRIRGEPMLWIGLSPMRRQKFCEKARAAIEAMREPTPEMFRAAYAENNGKWMDSEYAPPNACWRAMINAALRAAGRE